MVADQNPDDDDENQDEEGDADDQNPDEEDDDDDGIPLDIGVCAVGYHGC